MLSSRFSRPAPVSWEPKLGMLVCETDSPLPFLSRISLLIVQKLIVKRVNLQSHLQEIVRRSFKLKPDLDVIPSLSNENVLTVTA
jgi:hypothetical protein